MFNFRIITTADGNQIIDRNLKTPYNALTPTQMLEYTELDNQMAFMDRMERKANRKRSICGNLQRIRCTKWLAWLA